MSNFDAREYIKRKYSGKATEELVGINANAKQKYVTEKYRKQAEKELGFDTLEADLDSLGKTITSMYDGWQTEETMKNTRSSIETMYNRLLSYQDYRKKYGITEGEDGINKLVDAYKTTLNDWDKRTALYGDYKSADEFIAAQKNAEKQQARTKEFEGSDLNGLDNKLKITEGLLKQAKEYQAEINAVNKASGSLLPNNELNIPTPQNGASLRGVLQNGGSQKIQQGPNLPSGLGELKEYYLGQATGGVAGPPTEKAYKDALDKFNEVIAPKSNTTHKTPVDAAQEKLNGLLDQFGFSSVDDLESYYNALDEYRNKYVLEHGVTDLYQDYMDDSDFSKHSQYYDGHKYSFDDAESAKSHAKRLKNSLVVYDKDSKKYTVYANPIYEYINNTNNARELIDGAVYYGDAQTGTMLKRGGLHKLNSEEVQLFNYLDWLDAQNDTNLASEYLDGMEEAITKRVYDEQTQRWEDFVDSSWLGATAASIASIPASMVAPLGTIAEGMLAIAEGREYNPHSQVNTFGNFASDTRKYTGENIAEATEGFELFGQNIPSFAYQTGMSMGDTMLGSMVYGKWYSLAAGTNSFQQKAKEMKEAGADYETMMSSAFASGAAEMVFEYISLDKLMKIDSIDSGAAIFKSAFKQAGVEASEEFATELANIISDDVIRGSNSEINQFIRDLRNRGYSESEIKTELAKKVGGQLGWAAAGGFLSGGVMGGGQATISYSGNVASGKTIKSNERTGDMLTLASLTPQESAAYEAYSKYTGKGINADNITNAQLGNLYSLTDTDARGTLASKKSNDAQKGKALVTLDALSVIDTATEDAKRKKELNIGKTTKVNSTGESVAIEGVKVGKEGTILVTANGDVSVNDVTLTDNDADLVIKAEGIANEYGNQMGNLFIEQYDGNTDINDYAVSFNLAMGYAKNNITQDLMLENKGVLSTSQVQAIYKATVHAQALEHDNKLKSISESQGKKQFIKGEFKDSIIDYDSKTTDGSKVNWKDLTPRQKSAIKFAELFSKATGVNVTLIKSNVKYGKHKGKNGSYDPKTNTIEIDVYAGRIDAKSVEDSIIPTLSHEMTHWMKHKAPSIYESIRTDVMKTLAKGNKYNLSESDLVELEMKRLQEAHPEKKVTPEDAIDELVARACEDMLSNSNKARKLLAKMDKSEREGFIAKVKETFENLIQWVNDLLKMYKSTSEEAEILRNYKEMLKKISKQWDDMLEAAIESNQALQNEGITGEELAEKGSKAEKNTTDEGDVKKSDRITAGMSDSERAEILKNKSFTNIPVVKEIPNDIIQKLENISSWEDINKLFGKDKRRLIHKIAEEFGVFKGYNNADINISFEFSNNNFRETYGKQKRNYESFAKMFSVFDEVIENAIGIEVHNRNGEGYKPDVTLKNVYVLMSAFEDGDSIIPVKLEVKEFKDKQNTLYIAVSLNAIKKTEVFKQGSTKNGVAQNSRSVTISISNVFAKINPKDTDFLKYIPNQFLNEEQIAAKKAAISGVKHSDRDIQSMEGRYRELQNEYNALNKEVEEIKNSEKYKYFVDAMSAKSGEELDELIKEYGKWTRDIGLYDKSKRVSEIISEQKDIRAAIEDDRKISRDAYMKSIENLTEKEKMDFVKRAVERYGTTNKVGLASYLMLNGKMLDFSENQGYRIQDHREITEILDMPDSTEYSDGLIAFMNMGNIRMQTYGIDISQAPNQAQKTALRDVINQVMRENDEFSVDFSKTNGYTDGSVTYPKGTATSKILADIDNYFKTGVVPEYKSSIAEYRYSDRDTLGNALTKGQQLYFADSKMRDENGNLIVMYQGSQEEFFEFDRKKSSPFNLYGRGFYFSNSQSHADQYGDITRAYYLNIKNPIATYEGDSVITKAQLKKFLKVVSENENYSIENYGTYDVDEIANSVYGKSDYAMIQDISATAIGDLVEAIELFNEVNGTTFDGLILATETIIFNSEQAKLTTNKNPTDSTDIRYSDRDSQGHKLSEGQVEFFKDSKIRDEKGRLLAVYHGTKSAGFTRFTKTDEIGYFFARSLKTAQTYSNNSKVVYTPDRYTDTDVPNEANYQVYLNIKKPYIIDGKGANWNGLESTGEKVHLSIKTSYWGDDGKGLGKIVFKYGGKTYSKIVHNVNEFDLFISQHTNSQLAYACAAEMNTIADKNGKGKFEVDLIWDFKKRGNADAKNTRDIVRRAYESHWDYDGVIFKNVVDSGNGTKIKADDLYVAFNSNQIKSTANTEPTSDPDIRYSDRNNLGIRNEDYAKYLSKKGIRVSNETKGKISSQRISRYGDMSEEDIPPLDFFRVADYNKVNVAYEYLVRNDSKFDFTVIRKQQIKPQSVQIYTGGIEKCKK